MALTALVGINHRLDSRILEIFSNLDESGICDPGKHQHLSHLPPEPRITNSCRLLQPFPDKAFQ